MIKVVIPLLAASVLASTPAEACVELTGDADAIRTIATLLGARDIAIGDAACMHAHVERRGPTFVIEIDGVERVVTEAATAATVIESFVRDDVAPLLPVRPRPPAIASWSETQDLPGVPPATRPRRVQWFWAAEASAGSDRTSWVGGHFGVAIPFGPISGTARVRHARVVAGDGMWKSEMERKSSEILLGLDVPFAIGRTTLSPGFAAGIGHTWTRSQDRLTEAETGGLRADVHVTLTVPVKGRWAIDVSTALDLTQQTRTTTANAPMTIPDEPVALTRFAIGVRYGGR